MPSRKTPPREVALNRACRSALGRESGRHRGFNSTPVGRNEHRELRRMIITRTSTNMHGARGSALAREHGGHLGFNSTPVGRNEPCELRRMIITRTSTNMHGARGSGCGFASRISHHASPICRSALPREHGGHLGSNSTHVGCAVRTTKCTSSNRFAALPNEACRSALGRELTPQRTPISVALYQRQRRLWERACSRISIVKSSDNAGQLGCSATPCQPITNHQSPITIGAASTAPGFRA